MKRGLSRILSFSLALLMAMYVFPYEVVGMTAVGATADLTENDVEAVEEAQNEEAYVLHEVEDRRETSAKHYRMSDGSYAAVEFSNAVHYQNEDDDYVDIDNTITLSEDGYTNTDNEVEYTFSDGFDSDTILDCTYGEYGVSFGLIKEERASAVQNVLSTLNDALRLPGRQYIEISNPGEEPEESVASRGDSVTYSLDRTDSGDSEEPEKLSAEEWSSKEDKSGSSIKYVNISEGIDLRYDLIGNTLKEYIVLKKLPDTNEFSFGMSFDDLIPTLNEDKSITLANSEGESIFTIPAPYMLDGANNISYDCEYAIAETEQGYILTVTVSSEWLNDADREYPVMIDPALYLSKEGSGANSDIITQYHSQINGKYNIDNPNLFMGKDGSDDGEYIAYVKVNSLPDLPANVIPTKGVLCLAQTAYNKQYYMNTLTIAAKRADSSATWHEGHENNAILDLTNLSETTNLSFVYWDVTDAVKDWYTDLSTNTGIVFVPTQNLEDDWAKVTFYGSYANASARPRFVVSYRNTVGLDDVSSYHTQNVGSAGTGNVRYNDGALTVVRTDAVYDSAALPVSISHVYNSAYTNTQFTGSGTLINTRNYNQMYTGKGWKLSLQQTICGVLLENVSGGNDTYKIYTDADGTEQYFHYNSRTGKYEDESGLGRQLIVNDDTIVIKHKDGSYYEFYNGYLYRIQDANGNYIRIYYGDASNDNAVDGDGMPSASRNRIVKVTRRTAVSSTEKTVAAFTYNSGNFLTKITDCAGRTTEFIYNDRGAVSMIEEHTGYTSYYYYDESGTSPTNCMNGIYDSELRYGVRYTYYGSTSRVENITEYARDSSGTEIQGAKYKLLTTNNGVSYLRYYGNDRYYDNADDIVTTYLFDDYGRVVNSYSSNERMGGLSEGEGFTMYGMSAATYTETDYDAPKKNNRIESQVSTGGVAENIIINPGAEVTGHWSFANSSAYIASDVARNGTHSFFTKRYVDNDGGSTSFSTGYSLAPGEYTLSVYMKANISSLKYADGGVYLQVKSESKDYGISRKITQSTDYQNSWERISYSFTVTSSDYVGITVHFKDVYGYAYFDDFQLERSTGASRPNLLNNGRFEYWGSY